MAEEVSISEWLQKAKADPKLAAQPLMIILALAFMEYRFLYSPQVKNLEKENKKNAGVIRQMDDLKKATEDIDNIRLEVNELKLKKSLAEKYCYKQSEVPLFFQDLRKWGREAGIDLKSLQPSPPVAKTFETLAYEEMSVKIPFSGDLKQLGIFLRTLEKSDKIIKVDLPPLKPDASGTFKFDLNPTILVLSDPPAEEKSESDTESDF